MDGRSNISNDLFYKVRSRFSGLKLGTETGEITINPEDARFFDFDYKDGERAAGHVTISLAEPNSMKVYFSSGITESMEKDQKQKWYGFLKELREFAKRRLMAFDTRDISKDNLDRRDFEFLTTISQPKAATDTIVKPVGESVMNESQLYGTNRISYQRLMDTRLIIKHSKTLQDDQQPGARSRNISALFVENQDGERFKYPFIHLAGARAMQRHVANGGVPYDDIGKSIINMSEQIAQLKSFGNYVVRNDLMNSDTNSIVERSSDALNSIREQVAKLSKQGYYEHYKENFQQMEPVEIPQSVVEEFKEKFTVRSFREEISTIFPLLYKIMQEQNSVDYDDIVDMTTTESINDEAVVENEEDELEKFEQWVMDLGESSPLQSDEDQIQAIEDLNKMIAQAFPAGVDGTNAIESLRGIIDDPNLYKEIKDAARQNPQEDVRPMIKAWVDENAATIADQLDFGDMEQTAAEPEAGTEEPAAAEPATDDTEAGDAAAAGDAAVAAATGGGEQVVTQSDDNVSRGESKKLNVRELAEFIQSFYDRESGTFPKGPEGVCTMVGKKFGEQAEQVARKFVERMAPQQTTENNPELQELARIRELAGMQSEAGGYDPNRHPQTKDYGTGDEEDDGDDAEDGDGMKEGDRIRDISPEDDPDDADAADEDYIYDLANRVFSIDPNLSAKGRGDEVVDAAYEHMVRDLGKKRASYILRHDPDFTGELLDMYARLQHNGKSKGEDIRNISPELEEIRRLSGIQTEAGDEEGIEDLLAAVEEEMNDPGKHIDNLQDVMNATIDADDSPEYKKARAVINRYLELVTNTGVDHYDDDNDDPSAPAIGRMAHGDIARHIREYDLGDYLAHASHMLTKVAGQGESVSLELEDIRRLSGIAQGIGF
jgi:hypothetical protein